MAIRVIAVVAVLGFGTVAVSAPSTYNCYYTGPNSTYCGGLYPGVDFGYEYGDAKGKAAAYQSCMKASNGGPCKDHEVPRGSGTALIGC